MNTNKTLFETTQANTRVVGTKSYAMIARELLSVDEEYQRVESRSEDKIKKLALAWNPNQMDALKVVAHPEECLYSVVDGYGRLRASEIKNIHYLECEIIPAPTDIEERRRFEANIFLKQTEAVEPLKPAQMHKARLILNDPVAQDLDRLLKKYGVEYTAKRGRREEHYLGSYNRAYNTIKVYGKECLEFVFKTIEKAGYNVEPDGYCSYILDSLKKIHVAYPIVSFDVLGNYIRRMRPTTMKAKALATYSDRSNGIAVTLFLQDYITKVYGVEERIDIKGKIIA